MNEWQAIPLVWELPLGSLPTWPEVAHSRQVPCCRTELWERLGDAHWQEPNRIAVYVRRIVAEAGYEGATVWRMMLAEGRDVVLAYVMHPRFDAIGPAQPFSEWTPERNDETKKLTKPAYDVEEEKKRGPFATPAYEGLPPNAVIETKPGQVEEIARKVNELRAEEGRMLPGYTKEKIDKIANALAANVRAVWTFYGGNDAAT